MKRQGSQRPGKPLVIYGKKPVEEALAQGKPVDKIWVSNRGRAGMTEILELARIRNIPVKKVPPEMLNRIAGQHHQGVAAMLSLIDFCRLEDILPAIYDKGELPLILVLDGVTDVRNFGAIARSAACFDAHAIVTPLNRTAAINAGAIKASAGALHKIPVCRQPLPGVLRTLRLNGITLIVTDARAEASIEDVDLTAPVAFVMGDEHRGVSEAVRSKADYICKIPMSEKFDSLNVSVAAGIVLYETRRQRHKRNP